MYRLLTLVFLAFLAWGCGVSGQEASQAFTAAEAEKIKAALQATTTHWNQGNLEGFVALYDSSTTFMTANGLIGLPQLKERYQRSYFNGTKPKQQLSFSELEVRPLGLNDALLTGKFDLVGGQEAPKSGRFSLVFHRTAKGWKILHDHSS
jgi:ketosteroid isomerase-like protein